MRRCLLIVALFAGCDGFGSEGPDGLDCPDTGFAPSPRAPSSGRSRLVYAVAVDQLPQLWMIDLDMATPEPVRLDAVGDGPGPLLASWGPVLSGIWSPAGGLVAVRLASGALGPSPLAVIDVNAPGAIRDIGLGASSDPPGGERGIEIWSPQGDHLLTLDPSEQRVRVASARGGGAIDLGAGLGDLHDPSWAPDGVHVGVSVSGDGPDRFFVTPVDADAPLLAAQWIYWWGIAGTQVLNAFGEGRWRVSDVASDTSTEVRIDIEGFIGSARNYSPSFSRDGTWLFIPGASPHMRRWGCERATMIAGAPAWAGDALPTADGRYIVFTGADQYNQQDRSSAWAAKHLPDGSWLARHVFTPIGAQNRVHDPVVARTGSRAVWRVGWQDSGDFVVTGDDLRDPAVFRAEGLRVTDQARTHWFSGELDRLAYLVDGASTTLRVMDVADPRAATLVGELAVPSDRTIGWVAWSSDGSALAFAAHDPTLATPGAEIHVTRLRDGVLEPPRFLGTTLDEARSAFHWEP